MKDSDDVSRIIGLKRYETPGEKYYVRFAAEFKDRQRSELLHHSSIRLLGERVQLWSQQFGAARWAVPAGAVAAAVGILIALQPDSPAQTDVPAGIADGSAATETLELPPFPEAPEESIELTLPRTGIPPASPSRGQSGPILPSGGSLVEL